MEAIAGFVAVVWLLTGVLWYADLEAGCDVVSLETYALFVTAPLFLPVWAFVFALFVWDISTPVDGSKS